MQHAIARQAEAERERRAKIINAEGEAQAAAKLAEAADVIGVNPVTLQLRYLQTLREIGGSAELDDRVPDADRPDPLDAGRARPVRRGGDDGAHRGARRADPRRCDPQLGAGETAELNGDGAEPVPVPRAAPEETET